MAKEGKYGVRNPSNNRGPIWRETFDGITSSPNFGETTTVTSTNGVGVFNGSTSNIIYEQILNNVYSIRIRFTSLTPAATQYLLDYRKDGGTGYVRIDSTVAISASSGTIYVDGVLSSTISSSTKEITVTGITLNSTSLYIGSDNTGANFFTGSIELVDLFDYTLTATAVEELSKDSHFVITDWTPQIPTGLTLTVISDTVIKADWTNVDTKGDGAKLYISTDNVNFTLKATVALGVATVNATGLSEDTTYYFYVVSYKGSSQSETSNIEDTNTLLTACDTLDGTTISETQIDLTWNNNSAAATGIKVYISTDNETFTLKDTIGLLESYSATGLTVGTIYYFYVIPYKVGNQGSSSNVESLSTAFLGREEVVNGDFSSSSGWVVHHDDGYDDNWSVTGGKAVFAATSVANRNISRSDVELVIDKYYRVTFTISDGGAGVDGGFTGAVGLLFDPPLNGYVLLPNGVHSYVAKCLETTSEIHFYAHTPNGSFKMDDLSIKEYIVPNKIKVLTDGIYGGTMIASTLYAVNTDMKVVKSTDFGDTWVEFSKVFTGDVITLFVSKDGILFAVAGTLLGNTGCDVWRSADDGLNWSLVFHTAVGVTTNWGWTQAPGGNLFVGEYSNSGTNAAYIWKSTDNGLNWTMIDYFTTITDKHIHQLFVDPETSRLYATIGDTPKRCYYSDDNGANWTQIFSALGNAGFTGASSKSGMRYFADDLQDGDNNLWKSTDDNTITSVYKPILRYNTEFADIVALHGGNTVYGLFSNMDQTAGSYSIVVKSTDSGTTWSIIAIAPSGGLRFLRPAMDYRHRVPSESPYLICQCVEIQRMVRITL